MTSREYLLYSTWLLALPFLIFTTNVHGSVFRHIGCFKISSETLGLRFNYETLNLDQCATGCNLDGFPYCTMREGHNCFCVNDFGREGKAAYAGLCNYTCRTGDFNFLCGGKKFEDVYYAIDTDKNTYLPLRSIVVHDEQPTVFGNSRMTCVKENGDLPIIVDKKHLDAVWSVARSTNYSGVWIGAFRDPWGDGNFDWGGLRIPDRRSLLDISDTSEHWSLDSDYVEGGDCIILLQDFAKLKVVRCNETYPYICLQIPPPETTPEDLQTTPELAITEEPPDFFETHKWTLFWVCLPIFLVVFLGSCLLYTIYHIIIQCHVVLRQGRKEADPELKPFVDLDENISHTPVEKIHLANEAICATPAPVTTSADNLKFQGAFKLGVPDPDSDIDFTKLSISDIMYIKSITGTDRKKTRAKSQLKKNKAVTSM